MKYINNLNLIHNDIIIFNIYKIEYIYFIIIKLVSKNFIIQ